MGAPLSGEEERLHQAASSNSLEDLVEILQRSPGVDVDAKDDRGWTALHQVKGRRSRHP